MTDLHEYWQAVHHRVCPGCIEGDGHGNCLLDPALECTLQKSLPVIVDIVTRTGLWKMSYGEELHTIVCGECKYQTIDGTCGFGEEAECAVERYFPAAVEAVRVVYEGHRPR